MIRKWSYRFSIGGNSMKMLTPLKAEFLEKMQLINRRTTTINTYRKHLESFISFVEGHYNAPLAVDDVSEEDIDGFVYELKEVREWKTNSINLVLSSLRGYFGYAHRKGYVEKNVMIDIDNFKRTPVEKDFLTEEEMKMLIQHIKQPTIKLIVYTLAHTGLRITECRSLKLNDIDFVKNVVFVRDGKGGKARKVPMGNELAERLLYYRDIERPKVNTDTFFALERTGGISAQYVGRELATAAKDAGIDKKVSCHTMRHSFASALVKKQVNLPTVAALLGHADFRTVTSVYVHMEDSELADAVNQLEI